MFMVDDITTRMTPLEKALESPEKYESEIKYYVLKGRVPEGILTRVVGYPNVMRCLLDLVPLPFTDDDIRAAIMECSRVGDELSCECLIGALRGTDDLGPALGEAVARGYHAVVICLLKKGNANEEVIRKAFCNEDVRMFGILINLSSRMPLGMDKLFDEELYSEPQRKLLDAITCCGLVPEELSAAPKSADVSSVSQAHVEATVLSRFRVPGFVMGSCSDCGAAGFVVPRRDRGLLASLTAFFPRPLTGTVHNCAACGAAICGDCRRTSPDGRKSTLCRECFVHCAGLSCSIDI